MSLQPILPPSSNAPASIWMRRATRNKHIQLRGVDIYRISFLQILQPGKSHCRLDFIFQDYRVEKLAKQTQKE